MQLKEYIRMFPSGAERAIEIARIADRLKLSKSYLRGIISGSHPFPARIAIPLEKITDGKVTAYESCPEFYPKPYTWC